MRNPLGRDGRLSGPVSPSWDRSLTAKMPVRAAAEDGKDLNHRIAQCPLLSIDASTRSKPQEKSTTSAGRDHIPPTDQSRGGRPRTQGHIQALSQQDVQASNAVVPGILSIASVFARVLFDSRTTYFFTSFAFVRNHLLTSEPFVYIFMCRAPFGDELVIDRICRSIV
uniref:Uncharacterized protein n=1 Tax=Ananas comosus var. bracteatus TaxID=296719 RepID=A0A6V7PF19_ANACO|nr:unnamed protein product [Ananas comosus var. bracteatus]